MGIAWQQKKHEAVCSERTKSNSKVETSARGRKGGGRGGGLTAPNKDRDGMFTGGKCGEEGKEVSGIVWKDKKHT